MSLIYTYQLLCVDSQNKLQGRGNDKVFHLTLIIHFIFHYKDCGCTPFYALTHHIYVFLVRP